MTGLDDLRDKIAHIDREILNLIRQRMDLVDEVGIFKAEIGDSPLNSAAEAAVVKRYRNYAEKNGLDADNSERICRAIMNEAVEREKNIAVRIKH